MIGANGGGQLNIYLVEVGFLTTLTIGNTTIEIPQTVSVHPLLVVPSSIRYTDNSRSAIMQTTGGSIVTKGGRALRSVSMTGMWGVESRGLGPYIGTGEVRRERFYNEVVRMGDALTADEIAACCNPLTGTPFISLLARGFIEGATVPYLNLFDFYQDRSFQVVVRSYNDSREARQGGATGNVPYQITFEEVGPIVSGSLGSTLINGLLSVLSVWDDVNETLKTYTLTNIADSFVGVAAIGLSLVAESAAAVAGQVDSVQALMGAAGGNGSIATDSSNEGFSAFFGACDQLQATATAANYGLTATLGPGEMDNDTGAFSFETSSGEGSNRNLDTYDAIASTEQVGDSAAFYKSVGAYYGMSTEEYQNWIASGGTTTGPSTAGSETYTVTDLDTPSSIEGRFGVSWGVILDVNGLTPDEALYPGTVLSMPTTRPPGPQGIKGLPTFGSHIGKSAWGIDFPLEMTATDGDFDTVAEEDILIQGATFLAEQYGDDILSASNSVPDVVKEKYMAKRFSAVFLTDQRFATVESITVTLDAQAGAASVNATIRAINGGTITTGATA